MCSIASAQVGLGSPDPNPGLFRDAEYEGSGTSLTLTGLKADTEYEVEVRAGSMEGYGPWSDPGKARTPPDQGENTPPRFMSQAQMSVRENTMPVGTLVAVDDEQDAIIGYQITGGVDEGAFTIKNDNELWFKKAQDYENPGDAESIEPANAANNNECLVQVMATSGEGARKRTVTQMVLVRVTDVSGPERPAAPKVSSVAGSTTKLRVKWRAPESSSLPITGLRRAISHRGYHYQQCRNRQRRFRITKRAVIAPTTFAERLANNKKMEKCEI